MAKTLLKICIGGLAGIGLGLIVGKHKIDQLEAERDSLDLQNTCLTSTNELLRMENDNLREVKNLYSNLLLQEKEE